MRGRRGVVPPGAVYVGRRMARLGLAGSKWGNPFKIGLDGTRGDRQISRLVPSAARSDGRTPLAAAVATPLLSISREPATKTGRAEGLKFAGSRNARDVLERAPVALSPRCADHAANVRRCAMLVRGKSWARTRPGARLLIASQRRHSVCSRTPHACTRTTEAGRSVHRTILASRPVWCTPTHTPKRTCRRTSRRTG